MNYIEIAKLANFLHKEFLMRRFRQLSGKKVMDNHIELLRNYDINPVLVEMQQNFTQHYASERVVEQLKKDYEAYLFDLEHFMHPKSEDEKKIFERIYGKIKHALKNPTFLESIWVDTILKDNGVDSLEEIEGKEYLWFKVGLKFAIGEIKLDSILTQSAPKLGKALGLPSGAKKYIIATCNNYQVTNVDKNIYSSIDKMEFIANYCKSKNIQIEEEFAVKLKTLKESLKL